MNPLSCFDFILPAGVRSWQTTDLAMLGRTLSHYKILSESAAAAWGSSTGRST
jgi:hypothetical protein